MDAKGKKKAKEPTDKNDGVQTVENKPVEGYVLPPKQKKSLIRATLHDQKTGKCYQLLGATTRIGRDRGNHVALAEDTYVSRQHAWILETQDGYWIEDLGSINTTLLNGEPVTERKQLLANDKLTFGKTEMIFLAEK